jgi:hypothetical protein
LPIINGRGSSRVSSLPACPTVIARPRYASHQIADHTDELAAAVVDSVVDSELLQAFQSFVAGRRRNDDRAGAFGKLDGGEAEAAGCGMDQDGLAGLQPSVLEQTLIGRAERDRHARRRPHCELLRNHPGRDRRHRRQLRMRPAGHGCNNPFADPSLGDV